MAFTQRVLNVFKYFPLKYFVITAGEEKTHSTLRMSVNLQRKTKKPQALPAHTASVSRWRGELIGCAELSNMLQCIRGTWGVWCYSEVRQQLSTESALCCFPLWDAAPGGGGRWAQPSEKTSTWRSIESVGLTVRLWRSAALTRCPRESRNDHSMERCILETEDTINTRHSARLLTLTVTSLEGESVCRKL